MRPFLASPAAVSEEGSKNVPPGPIVELVSFPEHAVMD